MGCEAKKRDSHIPEEVKSKREKKKKEFQEKASTSQLEAEETESAENTGLGIDYLDADDNVRSLSGTDESKKGDDDASSATTDTNQTQSAPPLPSNKEGSPPKPSEEKESKLEGDLSGMSLQSTSYSRSPQPFGTKGTDLLKSVKRYAYPKYIPPIITLQSYFDVDESYEPIQSTAGDVSKGSKLKKKASQSFKGLGKKFGGLLSGRKKGSKGEAIVNDESAVKSANSSIFEQTSDGDEVKTEESLPPALRMVNNKSLDKSQIEPLVLNDAPTDITLKTFKLNLCMSEKFGLTVEEIMAVLDSAAPQSRLVRKLRDFLDIKMPSGFPVRLGKHVFFSKAFFVFNLLFLSAKNCLFTTF